MSNNEQRETKYTAIVHALHHGKVSRTGRSSGSTGTRNCKVNEMTLKDLSGVDWIRTLFPHFITERVAFRWINDEFTPVAMGEGIDENERYDDIQEVPMFNFFGFRMFLD